MAILQNSTFYRGNSVSFYEVGAQFVNTFYMKSVSQNVKKESYSLDLHQQPTNRYMSRNRSHSSTLFFSLGQF
jgi:hypothetical protein